MGLLRPGNPEHVQNQVSWQLEFAATDHDLPWRSAIIRGHETEETWRRAQPGFRGFHGKPLFTDLLKQD